MKKNSVECVGFIMDGNRRWAKDRGLPTLEGHRQGMNNLFESLDWVREADIKHVVYYTFSTENWRRAEKEVGYLMKLFSDSLSEFEYKYNQGLADNQKVRLRIIGRVGDLPEDLQVRIKEIEDKTKNFTGINLWLAMSYGGRAEIIEAVNQAVTDEKKVDEESFGKLLWSRDLPDPDIIIRTGGELRLSNFLTWQSVYSELFFTDTYWPALTKNDFMDILSKYELRERRRGK